MGRKKNNTNEKNDIYSISITGSKSLIIYFKLLCSLDNTTMKDVINKYISTYVNKNIYKLQKQYINIEDNITQNIEDTNNENIENN